MMLEKHLAQGECEQYYFQLIPISINILDRASVNNLQSTSSFRILLFKGLQNSNESNHIPAHVEDNKVSVQKIRMSFSLPHYNPSQDTEFTLKLINDYQEIGACNIQISQFIREFKNGNTYFKKQFPINPMYSVTAQLFVDKSRFSLQRAVQEMHSPYPKEGSVRSSLKDKDSKTPKGTVRINYKLNPSEYSMSNSRSSLTSSNIEQNKFISPKRHTKRIHSPNLILVERTDRSPSNKNQLLTYEQNDKNIGFSQTSPEQHGWVRNDKGHNWLSIKTTENQQQYTQIDGMIEQTATSTIQPLRHGLQDLISGESQYRQNTANTVHQEEKEETKAQPTLVTKNAENQIHFVPMADSITIDHEKEEQQAVQGYMIELAQSVKLEQPVKPIAKLSIIPTPKNSRSQPGKLQSMKKQGKEVQEEKRKPNQNDTQQTKNKIFLLILILISAFLVYSALAPTKKNKSNKKKNGSRTANRT